jgi:uncharacterized Zn finger protein (UPF0148 family)
MSNRKHVCFACRVAVRRDTNSTKEVKCPSCGKTAVNIGYKIPLPAKSKTSEWQLLFEQIHKEQMDQDVSLKKENVRLVHDLEKEIQKIESLPTNEGRAALLKQLKKKLAGVNA